MSGAEVVEDLPRGENGHGQGVSTSSIPPRTQAPLDDVLNPLATFRADAFLEVRRREEAENRRQNVLLQARAIHDVLLRADVHAGSVSILVSCAALFPENARHLTGNGFRVWEIADVHDGRPPMVLRSYHVTWDPAADFTFRPHFEKSYHKAHGKDSPHQGQLVQGDRPRGSAPLKPLPRGSKGSAPRGSAPLKPLPRGSKGLRLHAPNELRWV